MSSSPPRRVLHLIAQAHLDPVWLWPEQDGMIEALTTLHSAADRLAETPAFRFTRSSAAAYCWAKETDPRLFRRIRRAVHTGRWEVVGDWIEQADCNLPSAESFIRQALYGKAFMARAFGAAGATRIGYNVDSFGHAAGLPQILRQTGFAYYVFMRPTPADRDDIPLLFWWQSPDGARVLAQRIPIQYSQSPAATADAIEQSLRAAASQGFAPGFSHGLMFLGVGNHGGGPTRAHVARVRELQRDAALPELRFSTLRDYFAAVEQEPAFAALPTWHGELNFCFRGCYAADGAGKRAHRAAERMLVAAETLTVVAAAAADPARLREAWWHLGQLQFHDILAGTCVAGVAEAIRDRYGAVLDTARSAAVHTAARLARGVNTRAEQGSVLFVANPLPWPRTALVQLDTFKTPHGTEQITHLETGAGERVPLQWLAADANFGPWGMPWGKLTAAVALPAAGYRVFRVGTTPRDQALPDPFANTGAVTEQFVRHDDGAGRAPAGRPATAFSSLPLPDGRAVLTAPPDFVIINDRSGTWGHEVTAYADELGRATLESACRIEEGMLLTVQRQRYRWQASTLIMDVIHYAHSPAVELRVRFNWQQQRQLLKLEIPSVLADAPVVAKNAGAVVQRPQSGNEEPCHEWLALSGVIAAAPATLAVLNDASYSYSCANGRLRMTLARGVPHAEHPPFIYHDDRDAVFLDQGWQERRFWLLAAAAPWAQLGLDRRAQEWQTPVVALLDSAHAGTAPWDLSLCAVQPDTVAVLAVKPAEHGHAVILRVQEMAGQTTTVQAQWRGQPFRASLAPWQIKTLRITPRGTSLAVTESTALEQAL